MRLKELKNIRKLSGKTQEVVSSELSVPLNTYRGWEQQKSSPRANELNMLADYFSCSVDELMGRSDLPKNAIRIQADEENSHFVNVPVYGKIAAGMPIEMIKEHDYFPVPVPIAEKYKDAFLLVVTGESMNKRLPNGSYALVDPSDKDIIDNKPYALCVNGYDATIKRVHPLNNGFELIPDSYDPTFKSKIYNFNEPSTEEITIIGRVVWYAVPFDWEL